MTSDIAARRIPALALAAALAAVGAVSACSHADTPPHQTVTVSVSYDELLSQKTITRQADLRVGDTLKVALAANPSTGYQWVAQTQISDGAVLTQTGHRTIAPAGGPPGASGTEEWTFEAVAPGAATVTASYGQPWPGGQKNAWTFTAEVSVS